MQARGYKRWALSVLLEIDIEQVMNIPILVKITDTVTNHPSL
jgi:hypothetical protein